MKHIFGLTALLLLLLACEKDADGGNDSNGDFFKCKVDGQAYEITGEYAFADPIATDLFGIYGSEDQTQSGFTNVYISLSSEPEIGTYELTDPDIGTGNYLDTGSGAIFSSAFPGGSGTVEITEKTSSRVKGIFSYVAVNADGASKEITDGEFDVSIK